MPSRTLVAAISTLSGFTAFLTHNAMATLAAAVLLGLVDTAVRWWADKPRRDREQIGNQALRDIARENPERAVALLARLPPPADPFARQPSPAEGPAPPEPVTPLGGPAAGSTASTG